MTADKKGQKYWKDNYAPKLVKDKDYLQRHYKGVRHSTEYYQKVYLDGEKSTKQQAKEVKPYYDKPKVKHQKPLNDAQSAFAVVAIIIFWIIYIKCK